MLIVIKFWRCDRAITAPLSQVDVDVQLITGASSAGKQRIAMLLPAKRHDSSIRPRVALLPPVADLSRASIKEERRH
jgi:hypothetical protein